MSLYFVSPIDVLLLFLGKIETERPSDWLLYNLGRVSGLRVNDVDYSAPAALRALTVLIVGLGGFTVAASLKLSLGDETWALSSGIGSLMAAGIYEIGRPKRLTSDEAIVLEGQWQDFKAWADERCQPSGRAHQSEVINAFRKENRKYASVAVLDDSRLLDMLRNWHPSKLDRSASGYLKNMSLKARVDPFTLKVTGSAAPARAEQVQAAPESEAPAAELVVAGTGRGASESSGSGN